MQEIKIPNTNKTIGGRDVFIIAELGKGFIQTKEDKSVEEYLENSKALIIAAKESGVDAVKFQTHQVEDEQLNLKITSPHFLGSDRYAWVKRNTDATPMDFWREIIKICKEQDILFFSTPMSRQAAKILEKLDVGLWKVGSGDLLDFVMLDFMAETGKPIIISSGMSTLEDVDKAINFLKSKNAEIVLLHCVSAYPCSTEILNLNTIPFFEKRYGIVVGFSDHSIGVEHDVAAVNLGAKVIEKHFTLDRGLWGSDHQVAMLPNEMKTLVEKIRQGEKGEITDFGREDKILREEEAMFRPIYRKALMAGRDIEQGTILTKEMVYAMRPQKYAGGLASENYEKVLGKKVKNHLKKYDPITWEVLE